MGNRPRSLSMRARATLCACVCVGRVVPDAVCSFSRRCARYHSVSVHMGVCVGVDNRWVCLCVGMHVVGTHTHTQHHVYTHDLAYAAAYTNRREPEILTSQTQRGVQTPRSRQRAS